MQYMDIVIFNGYFHYRYINSATEFPPVCRIMLYTLRKVIGSFVKLLSSAINHPYHLLTFFKRYSDIIIFQEMETVVIPSIAIV